MVDTCITILNVPWTISPKVSMPELWILCSSCHLMMLYILIKFHENISNGFQVSEMKQVNGRNQYVKYSNGRNSRDMFPPCLWGDIIRLRVSKIYLSLITKQIPGEDI